MLPNRQKIVDVTFTFGRERGLCSINLAFHLFLSLMQIQLIF